MTNHAFPILLSLPRPLLPAALAVILLCLSPSGARADTYWNVPAGQTGDWAVTGNWTAGLPANSTVAYIANGGSATIAAAGAVCSNLELGISASGSGSIQMTGGSLSVSNAIHVGYSATGTFTQTGGTTTISGFDGLLLGFGLYHPSASGTYNLSGSAQLSAQYEAVGFLGSGSFVQSGGTNTVSHTLAVGSGRGSTGTYTLSGSGLLSANMLELGWQTTSRGTFTQTGGTAAFEALIVGYGANIPDWSDAVGTYTLSNGSVSSTGYTTVGDSCIGRFTQSGGSHTTANLVLASQSASRGTYDLNGGTLITPGISRGLGTPAFNFGGGTLKASGPMTVALPLTLTGNGGSAKIDTGGNAVTFSGLLSGAGGLILTAGGTLTLSGNNIYSGKTVVNGGTLTVGSEVNLGGSPVDFVADQLTLNGGIFQTTATTAISRVRGVTLGPNGGAISPNSATNLTVASTITGIGTLTKAGSGWLTLAGANAYTGGLVLGGGGLNINHPAALGAAAATVTIAGPSTINNTSGAPVTLSNNNPQVWNANFTFLGSHDLNLGTGAVVLGGNRTVTVLAGSFTVGGPISGSHSLIKAGAGTLTLNGANLYTGATTITAGKLTVGGSLAPASAVTVQSGGTVGGTGKVGSVTVNTGGHLAPGNSIGTLTLTGSLSLASGARLDFELDTPASSDMISMPSQTLTLGSGLQISNLEFGLGDGFGPGEYVLIDAGAIQGSFIPSSGTIGGLPATLSVDSVNQDLVLTVVPEPSSLALLGIGAVGLVLCGWRRIGNRLKGGVR